MMSQTVRVQVSLPRLREDWLPLFKLFDRFAKAHSHRGSQVPPPEALLKEIAKALGECYYMLHCAKECGIAMLCPPDEVHGRPFTRCTMTFGDPFGRTATCSVIQPPDMTMPRDRQLSQSMGSQVGAVTPSRRLFQDLSSDEERSDRDDEGSKNASDDDEEQQQQQQQRTRSQPASQKKQRRAMRFLKRLNGDRAQHAADHHRTPAAPSSPTPAPSLSSAPNSPTPAPAARAQATAVAPASPPPSRSSTIESLPSAEAAADPEAVLDSLLSQVRNAAPQPAQQRRLRSLVSASPVGGDLDTIDANLGSSSNLASSARSGKRFPANTIALELPDIAPPSAGDTGADPVQPTEVAPVLDNAQDPARQRDVIVLDMWGEQEQEDDDIEIVYAFEEPVAAVRKTATRQSKAQIQLDAICSQLLGNHRESIRQNYRVATSDRQTASALFKEQQKVSLINSLIDANGGQRLVLYKDMAEEYDLLVNGPLSDVPLRDRKRAVMQILELPDDRAYRKIMYRVGIGKFLCELVGYCGKGVLYIPDFAGLLAFAREANEDDKETLWDFIRRNQADIKESVDVV
ncbi:hypothetical protein RI367_000575 [Sorochytrium milnesiophthora]